jgi:hypothetical protein
VQTELHMQDTHTPVAMRTTLQYVLSNEMPTQHKSVLIALLTQALRDEDQQSRQGLAPKAEPEWRSDETQQLQTFLEDKIASSWQHADEVLMRVAAELRRSPYEVRKKATEIGLAAAIDYGVARTRPRPPQALVTTTAGQTSR